PHADRPQAITLGADKAYDAEDFINELRSMKVTPHVAQNTSGRSSAIDGRRTRANQVSRTRSCRMGLPLRCHRLQSDAAAEAVGGVGMSAPPNSTAAGGSSRPTFAIAIISLSVRASDKRRPIGILLQRPARACLKR